MLNRFNGNVEPFAKNSTSTNRTVFGGTLQSDDIDDNLNTDYKLGWEIVGVNDNPTKQDFNALGYTHGNLISYLYQHGTAVWNTSQKYYVGSRCIGSDGELYKSLYGTEGLPNLSNNPVSPNSTMWKIDKNYQEKDTIEELRLMTSTPGTVYVTGYHIANDGAFGSHFFKKVTDTGQVDNGGTIIRTVNGVYELQYSGAVNVKWFGAKGDGEEDDTVAIQNAIDSLSSGGVIFFQAGRYKVSSELTVIVNGVTLEGAGRGSIIETTSNTEHIIALRGQAIFPNDIEAVRVTNMAFYGTNSTSATGAAIYIRRGHENMVDHCWIGENLHGTGYGIYLNGTGGLDTDNNIITNNSITRTALTAIRAVSDAGGAAIEENIFAHNTISYCGRSGAGSGLSISGRRNTIIGNTIEESSDYGIVVTEGFNSIVGNSSNENDKDGIYIQSGNQNAITGNTCKDNDHTGTGLYSGIRINSDRNTVSGNNCDNNVAYGIAIHAGADNNVVGTNNLYNNGYDGLIDAGTRTKKGLNHTDPTEVNGYIVRYTRLPTPLTINGASSSGLSTVGDTTWSVHNDITPPFNAVGIVLDFQIQDSGAGAADAFIKIRKGGSGDFPTAFRCAPANDRWMEREASLMFTISYGTPTPVVSVSRISNIVTVVATGHGLNTGDVVKTLGSDQNRYNGVQVITKVDNDTFTYLMSLSVFSDQNTTPPTGTITYSPKLFELTYSVTATGVATLDANIKIAGWILG